MREIKFRAWLSMQEEMIYANIFGAGEKFAGRDCKIMQYTGLKDKNGREIYEGDIVYKYEIQDEVYGGEILGKVLVNQIYGVVEYVEQGSVCGDDEGFITPGFFIRLIIGRFIPKTIISVNHNNTDVARKSSIEPIIQDSSYLDSFGSFYPNRTPEIEIEIIGNIYENPELLN